MQMLHGMHAGWGASIIWHAILQRTAFASYMVSVNPRLYCSSRLHAKAAMPPESSYDAWPSQLAPSCTQWTEKILRFLAVFEHMMERLNIGA